MIGTTSPCSHSINDSKWCFQIKQQQQQNKRVKKPLTCRLDPTMKGLSAGVCGAGLFALPNTGGCSYNLLDLLVVLFIVSFM